MGTELEKLRKENAQLKRDLQWHKNGAKGWRKMYQYVTAKPWWKTKKKG